MGRLLLLMVVALRAACRSRADLVLENLALRQQVAVLLRAGRRPRVSLADRWFWVVLRRVWSRWTEVLVIVKPATVIRWHGAGFRLYWNWRSRRGRGGRPGVPAEVRELVRRLAENATWGRASIPKRPADGTIGESQVGTKTPTDFHEPSRRVLPSHASLTGGALPATPRNCRGIGVLR